MRAAGPSSAFGSTPRPKLISARSWIGSAGCVPRAAQEMRSRWPSERGAEVYLGHTHFTAPNAVEAEGRLLRFRKAVIATGSDPRGAPDRGTADRRAPDQRDRLLTD